MTTEKLTANIGKFLREWPGLSVFCSQNGWIDDDTLHFEIQELSEASAVVAVTFTEVIMEGSGCVADRRERFGKIRLSLDDHGRVVTGKPL